MKNLWEMPASALLPERTAIVRRGRPYQGETSKVQNRHEKQGILELHVGVRKIGLSREESLVNGNEFKVKRVIHRISPGRL